MIAHSTGASETLVAAANVSNFNAKVGAIAAVGPCLMVDAEKNWLPLKDIESVEAIFEIIKTLPSLFGPDHLT